MDVQEITMDPAKAREAFQAYSNAVKQKYNADYDALAKGYKAISQGKSVIDLHGALKTAGVDARRRPKFAVARADWEWVYFRSEWIKRDHCLRFANGSSVNDYHQKKYILVPNDCFPNSSNVQCKAQVPMVPPMYIPRGSLGNYHILFEADWEDVPVDPILLRHLSGALYAVLATWNLSSLERAVMRK
jgi:hypothetical protein